MLTTINNNATEQEILHNTGFIRRDNDNECMQSIGGFLLDCCYFCGWLVDVVVVVNHHLFINNFVIVSL